MVRKSMLRIIGESTVVAILVCILTTLAVGSAAYFAYAASYGVYNPYSFMWGPSIGASVGIATFFIALFAIGEESPSPSSIKKEVEKQ